MEALPFTSLYNQETKFSSLSLSFFSVKAEKVIVIQINKIAGRTQCVKIATCYKKQFSVES